MIKHVFIGAIALCCLTNSLFAGEVNTTLSSRYDVFPEHSSRTQDKSRSAELKLEAFHDFDDSRFVAELIGRADADDAGRRILEARQAYLRTPIAGMEAFIGHRQVFWGNAESKNVVDVINQSDAAAAQGSSAKLGAPSLSLERYMDSGDMQLWYITAFRQRTFNDSDAHPSSGIPVTSTQFERANGQDADDFAGRFSTVSGDWDLAGSLFYGTARDPILIPISSGTALQAYYPVMKSVGFEAQHTGENLLFKWESLHGTQASSAFAAAVMGIEYSFYGVVDDLWDIGVIAELQHDDRPQAAADQFLVGGFRLTLNDVDDTNLLFLVSADKEADQSLVSLEASKRLNSWSSIELSSTFFSSQTATNAYGLLSDDDSLSVTYNVFF